MRRLFSPLRIAVVHAFVYTYLRRHVLEMCITVYPNQLWSVEEFETSCGQNTLQLKRFIKGQ